MWWWKLFHLCKLYLNFYTAKFSSVLMQRLLWNSVFKPRCFRLAIVSIGNSLCHWRSNQPRLLWILRLNEEAFASDTKPARYSHSFNLAMIPWNTHEFCMAACSIAHLLCIALEITHTKFPLHKKVLIMMINQKCICLFSLQFIIEELTSGVVC